MDIVGAEYERPQFPVCSLKKITSLDLEHGVLVGDRNKLNVVVTLSVTDNSFEELANVLKNTIESSGPVHRVAMWSKGTFEATYESFEIGGPDFFQNYYKFKVSQAKSSTSKTWLPCQPSPCALATSFDTQAWNPTQSSYYRACSDRSYWQYSCRSGLSSQHFWGLWGYLQLH